MNPKNELILRLIKENKITIEEGDILLRKDYYPISFCDCKSYNSKSYNWIIEYKNTTD